MHTPFLDAQPHAESPRRKIGRAASIYVALALIVSAFLWGYQTGTNRAESDLIASASGTVEILNAGEVRASKTLDFDQFWTVWQTIRERYARQPVDESNLFHGAIAGVVASLGDPHSMYLQPQDAEEFSQELSGKFEGIGAEIGIKKGALVVVAPLPDSPAERAGLKAGDRILAIDETDATGLTVDEAVDRIRGEKGTTVKLLIGRVGKKAFSVEIVRDTIAVQSVKLSTVESPDGKKIAVVKISHFNGDTVDRFLDVVSQIRFKEIDGLILDLRNNPGGFLDGAIRIPGEWVDGEIVVSERYSDGGSEEHRTEGLGRLKEVPTVILVNGGSASASEIVAGALRDHGKAVLIGTQTFGKGSVQDLIDLKGGAALKLTIAEWFTPKGVNINDNGLAPDYVVERTDEDYEEDRDPQMDAARAWFDGVKPVAPAKDAD